IIKNLPYNKQDYINLIQEEEEEKEKEIEKTKNNISSNNNDNLLTFLIEKYNLNIKCIQYKLDKFTNEIIAIVEFNDELSQQKIHKLSKTNDGIIFNNRVLDVTIPSQIKDNMRNHKRCTSNYLLF